MSKERNMMNECHFCRHKRPVPGDCHITCNEPDPNMTGDPHGIINGWFYYPVIFDPTWKTKDCANFKQRD